MQLLSVVAPVFNESKVLEIFHAALKEALAEVPLAHEIVYVNDGSSDGCEVLLRHLHKSDGNVALIELSRNFGREPAVTAGLHHAHGDAVVVMDADMQDPPAMIPTFVKHWQEGYDVVYGTRNRRLGESWLKRASAHLFYRIVNRLSHIPLPRDTGDYRLLSRRAVDVLNRMPERHRYLKGLYHWVGFSQKQVCFDRPPRAAGDPKVNYRTMWRYALTGITSFSTAPVRLATYVGLLVVLIALVYLFVGESTLLFVVLLLGGVQLTTLGVMGEYIARMFDETKRRPLYVVKDYEPAGVTKDQGTRPLGGPVGGHVEREASPGASPRP